MVKEKENKGQKRDYDVQMPSSDLAGLPQIPEDIKKKLEELKNKIEAFKNELLKKYSEYILGVSLMPPLNEKQLMEKAEELKQQGVSEPVIKNELEQLKKQINVLVLVDDADTKKMAKAELSSKLAEDVDKIAKTVDLNLKPQTMLLGELREACFDGKYGILQLIAMSMPVHDPKDVLGALRVAEIHKAMTINKFEKYVISYVAAGSLFRGEKSNDIDVYIIVDDTDVKKMSRFELRDRLMSIIRGFGVEATMIANVKKSFHVQVYILTDFWDSIKDAHPVIFTLLRDGVPLYDRSVFMPWKLLLRMGRIKPSREAIDMQMEVGEKLLERIKHKLLGVVAEDLYYAILNPTQAALMLYGIAPPTPKETIALVNELFVTKEKWLDEKYVKILEETTKYYKDIEHGKVTEIGGKEIERLFDNAKDYLKKIKTVFAQIEKKKESEDIIEIHNLCISLARDALRTIEVESTIVNVVALFKKELVDKGIIPESFLTILKNVVKMHENYKEKKSVNATELEKLKKDARLFAKALVEYVQRTRGLELERAKVRFKYGKTFGEVLLLDKVAFIVNDIDAKEKEVSKAEIKEGGSLGEVEKSSIEEMEKYLAELKVVPEKVFIKEKIFDDLRRLFGEDVEILIG